MNLFTIPHTGSHLVRDEVIGGEWVGAGDRAEGNCFNHILMHNPSLLTMRMQQAPTIITVRHPRLAATSWIKRKKDVKDLIVSYYILVEILDKYDPLYLPIDSKRRDEYLEAINKALKTDYQTDWPMVSVHNTRKPDLGEYTEDIDRLCKNIKPFLDRFYGNKGRTSAKGRGKAGSS